MLKDGRGKKDYVDRGRRNSTFLEGRDRSHGAQVSLEFCLVCSQRPSIPLQQTGEEQQLLGTEFQLRARGALRRCEQLGNSLDKTHTLLPAPLQTPCGSCHSALERNVVLVILLKNYKNAKSFKGIFEKGENCTLIHILSPLGCVK